MFISSVKQPTTKKEKLFDKVREAVQKDIARTFGVLQTKWKIIYRPSHFLNVETISAIMKCVILLHNMLGWPSVICCNNTCLLLVLGQLLTVRDEEMMEDGAKHSTKRLIIKYVWEKYGEEKRRTVNIQFIK